MNRIKIIINMSSKQLTTLLLDMDDFDFREMMDEELIRRNIKYWRINIIYGDGGNYSSVKDIITYNLKASSFQGAKDNLIAKFKEHLKYADKYKEFSDKKDDLSRHSTKMFGALINAGFKDFHCPNVEREIVEKKWHSENPPPPTPVLDCPISWIRANSGRYCYITDDMVRLLQDEHIEYDLEYDIEEIITPTDECLTKESYGHHE
jgi:hypothetical protein